MRFDIVALDCSFLNWKKVSFSESALFYYHYYFFYLLQRKTSSSLFFVLIIIMSILITHQVERLCVRGKQLEEPGERSEPGPVFTQGAKCSCRAGGGGGSAG